MKAFITVALAGVVAAQANSGADCPALPGGVKMGPAIPMVKADIPTGCAKFEVLVGT